jgi:hypothetical protein
VVVVRVDVARLVVGFGTLAGLGMFVELRTVVGVEVFVGLRTVLGVGVFVWLRTLVVGSGLDVLRIPKAASGPNALVDKTLIADGLPAQTSSIVSWLSITTLSRWLRLAARITRLRLIRIHASPRPPIHWIALLPVVITPRRPHMISVRRRPPVLLFRHPTKWLAMVTAKRLAKLSTAACATSSSLSLPMTR